MSKFRVRFYNAYASLVQRTIYAETVSDARDIIERQYLSAGGEIVSIKEV